MRTKWLLYMGVLSPLLFWTTTLLCGLFLSDYNHLNGLVSQLGAMGTDTQHLFTAGLVLSSALNLLFVIGMFRFARAHQLHRLPVAFLVFYSFLAGPAIVPMPLPLHGIVGLPFVLLMLAPILALILWRKKENILKLRTAALISCIFLLLSFLVLFPNILPEYIGLKQRLLYAGWTIWSVSLSYRALKVSHEKLLTGVFSVRSSRLYKMHKNQQ
jgi:hypothetical membrane protein